MRSKLAILITICVIITFLNVQPINAELTPGLIYEDEEILNYRNVTVYAPAVARTDNGYVGVISTITVTIHDNGSGRVFVDTLPLTQVDMQGSARLAVKVASALIENDENCTADPSNYDYFFVVRTDAPIIGGPSAGAIMTVATVALLENWDLDETTVMTGMINPDGSIGPIGGVPQKIDAAWSVGAKRFLIPEGQGTYTELIADTSGWITVNRPVVRKVTDYVQDKGYEMEVVEVAEVNQALNYFTGYTFDYGESDSQITTEDYNTSMKPLASTLLKDAGNLFENASSIFENSSISNAGFDRYRDFVEGKLKLADNTLKDSQRWYDEEKYYYTSTSKSFQSLIYSKFVIFACEYYEAGYDRDEYINDLLSDVTVLNDNASENAKNEEIKGFITLQSVGAAQRRASEAKQILDEAKSNYENNNLTSFWDELEFLEDIAFVVERSNSIDWWINIGTKFNDTGDITNSTVENLALEYIEEAQQSAIYSNVLLEELGSSYGNSINYLTDANSLLVTARNNLDNGYPAAALFEALEALVKANLAIEIIGTSAEEKINFSKETANTNIARSRKQGIEPVLAVSYYEFGESLNNDSEYNSALMYYKYSGMIAGALRFTNVSTGAAPSRYVGIPEINPITRNNYWVSFGIITSAFIIGGLAGLGFGLIIAGIFYKQGIKETKKKQKKKEYSPGYVKYQGGSTASNYKYPDNQIPRSIRDYYKNNDR